MTSPAAGASSPRTQYSGSRSWCGEYSRHVLGGQAGEHDHAGEQVGVGQGVIPGHVAAGELAGDEHAVAVDGVALAGVAEGQLDGGVLAGRVAIVVGLARQVVLGGDQDVAVPRGLRRPLVDGGGGPGPGMQDDQRRVTAERVILGREPDGVLGRLGVLVLQDAMQGRLVGGLGGVVPRRGHELDDPGEQLEPVDGVGSSRRRPARPALEPGRLAAAARTARRT